MGYSLPKVAPEKIEFCKTINHNFSEFHNTQRDEQTHWTIYLRCANCTAQRWDLIDFLGELVRRSYHYPSNYRDYPKGLRKAEQRLRYLEPNTEWGAYVRRWTRKQKRNGAA